MPHDKPDLNRRDFARITAAALAGTMTGSLVGCGKDEPGGGSNTPPKPTTSTTEEIEQKGVAYDEKLLLSEPHVCCGLNLCKGHGACKTAGHNCKGKNECAGLGKCASAEKHVCSGLNDCKGQGGCGTNPGENSCSEKGACAVPLKPDKWKMVRAKLEKLYEAEHGKAIGAAPEECGKKS